MNFSALSACSAVSFVVRFPAWWAVLALLVFRKDRFTAEHAESNPVVQDDLRIVLKQIKTENLSIVTGLVVS